ncbi:MAG: peptide chain release factor 3, partial [Melioribacteraceae bacterium]|nr:peptide chain release factor 3 [Melioribacteraceae bacterium]
TPVIVLINKLDREGREPVELLDEIEKKLSIKVRPLTYPFGMGVSFRGVYNIMKNSFQFYQANKQYIEEDIKSFAGLDDPELFNTFGDDATKLKDDIELVDGIYDEFSREDYLAGNLAPVFFGSALNNFGIKELLDTFVDIAPTPVSRETTKGIIEPTENKFSGFVFKIHANLDPKHRDRMAFIRICSGKFERNKYYHHVRLNRDIKFPNPASFLAQSKSLVESAFPGDVIGLYDSGTFKIGDTLTEGENFMFKGIPRFSPEIFRVVQNKDPFKSKQLEKGLNQLTDEGLAQLFVQPDTNRKVIGVVGELQFDVIKYRLLQEFGATVEFSHMNAYKAFWLKFDNEEDIEEIKRLRSNSLYIDKTDELVFIAESSFAYSRAQEKNSNVEFLSQVEHNDQTIELDY